MAPETAHAVATDILAALCARCGSSTEDKRDIAQRHGVTYEQVRTVERNLKALAP